MAIRVWGQVVIQATAPAEDPVQAGMLWYDSVNAVYKMCTSVAPYTFVGVVSGGGGVLTTDPRLSDARTPTAHASTHQAGGSDQVATPTPGVAAIPRADNSGKLVAGWLTGILASSDLSNDSALEKVANKDAASGYLGLDANSAIAVTSASTTAVFTRTVAGNGANANAFVLKRDNVNIPVNNDAVGIVLQLRQADGAVANVAGIRGVLLDKTNNTATGALAFCTKPTGAPGSVFETEVARFDNVGNFLINATADVLGSARLGVNGGAINVQANKTTGGASVWPYLAWNASTAGDGGFMQFGTEGTFTARGSITYNRAGGLVAYNTSSDARLKRSLGKAITHALRRLKVHEFEWRDSGIRTRGLFAQEAHRHVPYAVTEGTSRRDRVTGKLTNPWGVDYGKLSIDLIVGWQEHEREIAMLRQLVNKLSKRGRR